MPDSRLTIVEAASAGAAAVESEVARQLQICNACRYCEGFCAVFPAMTRRLEFNAPDIHYLANLCHNCGACLHACQYAPPHEFRVNIPKAMAQARVATYENYAWPGALGAAYRANGAVVVVVTCIALAVALGLAARGVSIDDLSAGNFYAVFPHGLLAATFGAVALFAVVACAIGVVRFWREAGESFNGDVAQPALAEAVSNVISLRYLGGGHGEGCNETDDAFVPWRRWMHHLTFWGFLLCFGATCVATLYHYVLGRHAPYALSSLPVILGTVGGAGLLVGPAGLLWLNLRRHRDHGDVNQRPMDRAFIALLIATSATGLLLLALRSTAAMPTLLAAHLGVVLAFFVLLPYGKFVHGLYRSAALLKYAIERRRPNRLQLGTD